jgi:hypothetical protein
MGPIRQRAGELHTAAIELSAKLLKGGIDPSWLPKHTFVVLSQIQSHAAEILEDLDQSEPMEQMELDAIDNSLDSMIETYEDLKKLTEDAMHSFRRNNFSVVKLDRKENADDNFITLQVSLGGTAIWRRITLPASSSLHDLHRIIKVLFSWEKDKFRFTASRTGKSNTAAGRRAILNAPIQAEETLDALDSKGTAELLYEYGTLWTLKILFLRGSFSVPEISEPRIKILPIRKNISTQDFGEGTLSAIRCIAGEGAAPPPSMEGPLEYKKYLAAAKNRGDAQFDPDAFDAAECNRRLAAMLS